MITNGSDGFYSAPTYHDVKQINLHHAKRATDLIAATLSEMHTKNQRLIVLIQEPYIVNNDITGFDPQLCNIFPSPNGSKRRTCIVATKDVEITMLPQFCDGDLTSVQINTDMAEQGENIIICSAYMPFDAAEERPGSMVMKISEFCSENTIPLIIGADTNSHHPLWGSSDTNQRGRELVNFLAQTDLEILNKGNEPTFVTEGRSEVLDVTFATRDFIDRITKWHVSKESLSDHREINFLIEMAQVEKTLFRNPRNTNWESYKNDLNDYLDNMHWDGNINSSASLDTAVEALTRGIPCAFTTACPSKVRKSKTKRWWCKELDTLKRETRHSYRSYRNVPDTLKSVRWAAYKIKRNEYGSKIEFFKKNS